MSVKKLVEVWDGSKLNKENILYLKQPTVKVRVPYSNDVKQILEDLLDTYKQVPCAGIAANQIGYNKRIFIGLKHDDEDKQEETDSLIAGNSNANNYEFYINPTIQYSSRKSIQEGEEGCLSIPDIRLIAERYDKIKVRYFNQDGEKINKPLSGFMSRLFQHELDHLDGVLMVENKKIKSVYKISDNSKLDSLYGTLLEEILEVK